MTDPPIDERFYFDLLPALYRVRDRAQGEPLRALLAILERELQAVRDDTQGLYDDWFIETCAEWVVPYIGDLLGVELQRSLRAEGFTQRAYVANTLRYRRRKGTATVLEQLARDVSGWPTRAVEYFERLACTQHLQHLRLHAPATTSLRDAEALELLGGPFGRQHHSPELRSITASRGRFNIPNVGLHVWRLRPYPLARAEARAVEHADVAAGRYHFDALGRSVPLINDPRAETEILHLAGERDVPDRLRRRALFEELAPVIAGAASTSPPEGWFGLQPVLRVTRVDAGVETELRPPRLRICALVGEPDEPEQDWPRPEAGGVLVDPETGRLTLPPPSVEAQPDAVLVDYVYAFSADLGGGPYDRRATLSDRVKVTEPGGEFQQGVSKDEAPVADEIIHTELGAAIEAWNLDALQAWAERRSLDRVIVIMDSRSYAAELTRAAGRCVLLPPNSRLRLVAARWPAELDDPVSGAEVRRQGRLDPMDVRPHLIGDLEVVGLADPEAELGGGRLELDGLLIEGGLRVLPGALGGLALRHSTLSAGHGGLRVESSKPLPSTPALAPFEDQPLGALATNAALELELRRAVVDGLSLTGPLGALTIVDSIVAAAGAALEPDGFELGPLSASPLRARLEAADADIDAILELLDAVPDLRLSWARIAGERSVAGPEVDAEIRTSTLLGVVELRELIGSESIFAAPVDVRVVQAGCLRYSYAPVTSRAPRRFRCQPDLALAAAETAAEDAGEPFSASEAEAVRGRLRPLFTSTSPRHPAYCQLSRSTDPGVRAGAEDGNEMGAFHMLEQAHRESNLRAALAKHLRFGLDAGVFYVT